MCFRQWLIEFLTVFILQCFEKIFEKSWKNLKLFSWKWVSLNSKCLLRNPCYKFQSTGIGKIVRQLSRSEEGEGVICEEVRREALKVYKDWKGLVESRVQKKIEAKHIEVACDEDTIKARQTTVSLFRQAVIKAKQNSSGLVFSTPFKEKNFFSLFYLTVRI